MFDLCFLYSAKMAVVFFILMLSSTTLEAQRNENDKFFDLMTAIVEDFSGEFNDAEKALKLDLNSANSFLERLHRFATREIVRKNENGEFECKKSKKLDFKMVIKTILDEDMLNMLKVIRVKYPGDEEYKITSVLSEKFKPNKKLEDLVKELSVKFSEEKLFNLLFSFAARLEALVHGKNIDGTLKEKQKNSKDKIQTFLAVPKCFPESDLSIFDYWIEIIEIQPKNGQNPIFGVSIYKEKYDVYKSEHSKEKAFRFSRENYEILKQLNDQKFSIYEATNLLRAAFNQGYSPRRRITRGEIPQIFKNLFIQIHRIFFFNWLINEYWHKSKKYAYAMFFQNISENLMKMMSDNGIDPKLHLDSQDKEIREEVQKKVEENCKKFDNEEAKLIFLNNVHYELAIHFDFNQRKDVHDRAEDLLSKWAGAWRNEELYLKMNAELMLDEIKHFTLEKTNREAISIIEALIGKEHIDQFNLGSLFDQIKTLVEVAIPEEEANLEKAKEEINTKQLENEIEFLNNNPKSIAEEKYQKAVAIICTVKQLGEKVKMLASKNKTFKIKEQLDALSSRIENYTNSFGPKLWKQTEEFCNQLKHKQIQMEEIVSEEELLKDLQFEFKKIWHSFNGVWEGIKEYYLSIPLMQLIEQARTLAKTFEKMLENVKEHYAQKMDESDVGEDMIIF